MFLKSIYQQMSRIGILVCQHIQIARLYEDADGITLQT